MIPAGDPGLRAAAVEAARTCVVSGGTHARRVVVGGYDVEIGVRRVRSDDRRRFAFGHQYRVAIRVDARAAKARGLPCSDYDLDGVLVDCAWALGALFDGEKPVFDGAHGLGVDTNAGGAHVFTMDRYRVAIYVIRRNATEKAA